VIDDVTYEFKIGICERAQDVVSIGI